MEKTKSYKEILKTILITLLLISCQKEIDITILPPPADAFTTDSNTAIVIKETSLHDGSYDNILDSASCFSVILPVTAVVNGRTLVITQPDELKLIERIWDESTNDNDYVLLNFPINILFADHSTRTISTQEELHSLRDECIEGGADDDIECIDFAYPVKINIYDTQNQVTKTQTINDDKQLYDFLESLDDKELITFTFPLIVILSDGTEITINDNSALESVIENAASDCDEDDDNDFKDDDLDDSNLITILLSETWKISSFIHENENETSDFTGFEFTFNPDGTALATKGALNINGTWQTYGNDGVLEIDLYFGEDDPLENLDEDWKVKLFSTTVIHLVDDPDKSVPERSVVFEKL